MRNAILLGLLAVAACGSENKELWLPLEGGDGGPVRIGSPCAPHEENDPAFGGFSRSDLVIESTAGQPGGAPVCLVLNFQGRVSCPYGQDASGAGPNGTSCKTPGGSPVTVAVEPQCVDLRPGDHAIWSCRCAASGEASDVCSCPSGMACDAVLPSLAPEGANNDDTIHGSYCVPSSILHGSSNVCDVLCDPVAHPCD